MPFLEWTVPSMSSPQLRIFVTNSTGAALDDLKISDLVECKTKSLLILLRQQNEEQAFLHQALELSRFDKTQKEPLFQAILRVLLYSLPEIRFVAHAHPPAVGAFFCIGQGAGLVNSRLSPYEIFWCGESSVLVPYYYLGIPITQVVKEKIETSLEEFGELPRIILNENFGLLTFGKSPDSVFMAMSMCKKLAHIRTTASHWGKINPLKKSSPKQISALARERRKALRI